MLFTKSTFFFDTDYEKEDSWTFFGVNYQSFGSPMTGRNYSSSNYRFGFNGKENDNEVKGQGNQQDYGMRIYDPRLGRFLSVDPITKSYPELTPYQFASNRPIDGIDMDGLEYITVNILLQDGGAMVQNVTDHTATMSDAQIQENHGMSAEKFYSKHSKSFLKEKGQGILYNYYTMDKKGALSKVGDYFENKESIKSYGIYAGGGCLTYCGGNDEKNPFVKLDGESDYNFTQTPLDEFDGIAQKHDITQSKIPDFKGHWDDPRTLESDNDFVKETEAYIKRASGKGYKDEYTGRAPSKEALKNAKQALIYFKVFEVPRKENLNKKENESK
jgi:RHS repeat-associated protein